MSKILPTLALAVGSLAFSHANIGPAQGATHTATATVGTTTASTPQSQLDAVSGEMNALLKEGERVAARLAREIHAHPHEANHLVQQTETTLSGMADQTTSTSDVIKEVAAIRAKALAYRQAVMAMPAGTMSEADRQRVLDAWNRVIKSANKAQAAVADIHTTLLAELRDLRMRDVAVGQLMLAGEYQAALHDVLTWTKKLRVTIEKLNTLISGPTS